MKVFLQPKGRPDLRQLLSEGEGPAGRRYAWRKSNIAIQVAEPACGVPARRFTASEIAEDGETAFLLEVSERTWNEIHVYWQREAAEEEDAARRAWYRWCDTHELPADIPRDPDVVYRGKGWVGWVDWIGRHLPDDV